MHNGNQADPALEGAVNAVDIPHISIQAFCETQNVGVVLEQVAIDRHLMRANMKVHAGGLQAAIDFYRNAPTPNLVILENMLPPNDLVNQLHQFAEVCDPATKVVIIGQVNDISLYRHIVQLGISQYVVAPISVMQILQTISDIYLDPNQNTLGKVVSFVSGRGGSGSSTIAQNVAWSAAVQSQVPTVLVDMDFAFGSANLNFNQSPVQGVADLILGGDRVDSVFVERLMAPCAENLSLLISPTTVERFYDIESSALDTTFGHLKRSVPLIIVDLPSLWSEWVQSVVQLSDEVVVTMTPELTSLRNTKNLMELFGRDRQNDAPPKLIVNQVNMPKRVEIGIQEITGALSHQPTAVLPFDAALFSNAANNGKMIGETDERSEISKTFKSLADEVLGRQKSQSVKSTESRPNLLTMLGLAKAS